MVFVFALLLISRCLSKYSIKQGYAYSSIIVGSFGLAFLLTCQLTLGLAGKNRSFGDFAHFRIDQGVDFLSWPPKRYSSYDIHH